MTTPTTTVYPTAMTVTDLIATVAMLRARHQAILDAHMVLLDYGIDSQRRAVIERLNAIKTEAFVVADRLAALGEEQEASHAACGWLIVTRPKASRS
jgi:hypothetical protein